MKMDEQTPRRKTNRNEGSNYFHFQLDIENSPYSQKTTGDEGQRNAYHNGLNDNSVPVRTQTGSYSQTGQSQRRTVQTEAGRQRTAQSVRPQQRSEQSRRTQTAEDAARARRSNTAADRAQTRRSSDAADRTQTRRSSDAADRAQTRRSSNAADRTQTRRSGAAADRNQSRHRSTVSDTAQTRRSTTASERDTQRRSPAGNSRRTSHSKHANSKNSWQEFIHVFFNYINGQMPQPGISGFLHLILFPIVFVYFEVLLRIFGDAGLFSNLFYPVVFGLGMGLIATCITSVFTEKVNHIITIVLLFVTGLIFIVECLIRNSYQVYMTFGAILTGAGGVVGGFAGDLVSAIIKGIPVIILFMLPGILYLIFGKKRMPAWRYPVPIVVLSLVIAVVFSGVGVVAANIGATKDKYKNQFEFNISTETFGLLTTLRLNTKYAVFGNDSADTFVIDNAQLAEGEPSESETSESEAVVYEDNVMDIDFAALSESASDETIKSLHTYVDSLTPTQQNEYTGLFEGKNLILICAEAFSDSVISEELTPTLYRLVHNGFYFSDYYQPTWGGSTSSGEYSFLMGIVPMNGVETMVQDTRGKNLYFTLGNQLQRLGYYSMAYHNGEYDFYDRYLTHENLGYDGFLATGNGLEDITDWYPTDSVFLDKTLDTYIDQQPFSIYYMTVSGHCSYVADKVYVTENLDTVLSVTGGKYKDTTNYYLCYQLELEKALKVLVEKLETAGIADDTVICMTADHYPYGLENGAFGNTDDYVSDLYGYKYSNSWEQDHNTLIIWSGCLENENKDMACEISAPTSSMDIVPTLSNLFGLEYDSRLLVGRDVFSDAEALVLWNNYSWVTEKGKYNSATGTFEANEGETVSDAYVERIKNIVSNKLSFSSKVLSTNYYGVLFGEDND